MWLGISHLYTVYPSRGFIGKSKQCEQDAHISYVTEHTRTAEIRAEFVQLSRSGGI